MKKFINKLLYNWNYGYWFGVVVGWISMYLALKTLTKF